MTWGRGFFVPSWLYGMTPEQVEAEVLDRITGVVSYFQDRLVNIEHHLVKSTIIGINRTMVVGLKQNNFFARA